MRQDRPRVAVEPLRMERVAPQHTVSEGGTVVDYGGSDPEYAHMAKS